MRRYSPLVLDWYLVLRFLNPFAQGVAMFLGLLLALDVAKRALDFLEAGGSALDAVKFFFLCCPQYLVLSLPMAMLFGGIYTFGQLSSDNELTAMTSAGLGFRRLIVPLLAFAFAVSVFSFYVSEVIAPWCNREVAEMKSRVSIGSSGSGTEHRLWSDVGEDGQVKMVVYAESFDPTEPSLRGVSILRYEYTEDGRLDEIYLTLADTATFAGEGRWTLENATTKETLAVKPITTVEDEIHLYRPPSQIVRPDLEARTMTISMLRAEIANLGELAETDNDARRVVLTDRTELALRFALPIACLIFTMAGCPMGVRPERTTRGMSYGLSFGIILLYYILMNYMTRLGYDGSLPAWIAAWAANAVLGAVGIWLIVRVPQ